VFLVMHLSVNFSMPGMTYCEYNCMPLATKKIHEDDCLYI
jgi:hypothetical protein